MSVVESKESPATTVALKDFVNDFGASMHESLVRSMKPLYSGEADRVDARCAVLDNLIRKPFEKQAEAIHAISNLLLDENAPAAVINGEMGTGKTMMGIGVSAVMNNEGFNRFLVLSPPHLVYKWRREILDTVPKAKVWVLNGPDTLARLIAFKESIGAVDKPDVPEYYILGRVRMRMDYHWKPVVAPAKAYERVNVGDREVFKPISYASCTDCGAILRDSDDERILFENYRSKKREFCEECNSPLWSLYSPKRPLSYEELVKKSLLQLPGIGKVTAEKLMSIYDAEFLASMLEDNYHDFVNLSDENGEYIFTDKFAKRLEKAFARIQFGFGQGGYQPSEYIKRYLPKDYFSVLMVDEGHEYKNLDSAQGQAMGVLCTRVNKVLLLTGTLMGGYADDIFYLLWRAMPQVFTKDGYKYQHGSLASAGVTWMRHYGILEHVRKVREGDSIKTARGKKVSLSTKRKPGFSPEAIARYLLPFTVFITLADIGENVLPEYVEEFIDVDMSDEMEESYKKLESNLKREMQMALRKGDKSLMGTVLHSLLSYPDTSFMPMKVVHPHNRMEVLGVAKTTSSIDNLDPKIQELIKLCTEEKAKNRKVLVYSNFTKTRDATSHIVNALKAHGFKVACLRSSVKTERREEWIEDQVTNGCEIMVTNQELVKTGLDLLDFPTIAFMQTGYNVYTLMQARRRSYRIGQEQDVRVVFFGYVGTAQWQCLTLMAEKMAVCQSTSGEIPENGLESLNPTDIDSIEVELAMSLAS